MIIKIDNISLPVNHSLEDLRSKISQKVKSDNFEYKILKKSIDSRKKHAIKIIYSVTVKLNRVPKGYSEYKKAEYIIPKKSFKTRPIIVGFGPAGMFCGLVLAKAGSNPIILERGKQIEDRILDVDDFFKNNRLNPNSNIQFGEGGAGTFSDGKLSTGVKDKFGRREFILDEFVKAGANKSIKYLSKPHLGTDYLIKIVRNIRKTIISLGGNIYFDKTVSDIKIIDDKVKGVFVNDEYYESDVVVFATGHSSRDTFEMLYNKKISMETKPFAVGLRIEHPQKDINIAQYGTNNLNEHLLTADYKLTCRTRAERAVYSFCMCPGGFVVNSSSEKNRVCINGMSNYKRNSLNANSAVVVAVSKKDWSLEYGDDVLSGIKFQRDLEKKAYELGGSDYSMPIQTLEDYKNNKTSTKFGNYEPVNKGQYNFANLNELFPSYINQSLKESFDIFAKKINGYNRKDAILTGVESRTSSPVKVLRNKNLESNVIGLYFAGEGAGYAGGIMSAAIDGMKIAERL